MRSVTEQKKEGKVGRSEGGRFTSFFPSNCRRPKASFFRWICMLPVLWTKRVVHVHSEDESMRLEYGGDLPLRWMQIACTRDMKAQNGAHGPTSFQVHSREHVWWIKRPITFAARKLGLSYLPFGPTKPELFIQRPICSPLQSRFSGWGILRPPLIISDHISSTGWVFTHTEFQFQVVKEAILTSLRRRFRCRQPRIRLRRRFIGSTRTTCKIRNLLRSRRLLSKELMFASGAITLWDTFLCFPFYFFPLICPLFRRNPEI